MERVDFEPLILAFCCNWRSYVGADLCGTSRTQYPPNVRIIRVMCTGRIDPVFVLSAFKDGADGVIIAGCHPGDCHYARGNFRIQKRVDYLKTALKILGVEPDRLRLEWISASEGEKFAYIIKDVTKKIKELGPSQLKKDIRRIQASIDAFKTERLRWILGLFVLGPGINEEKYRSILEGVMKDEIERRLIVNEFRNRGPLTIKELSEATGIERGEILQQLISLENAGVVSESGVKDDEYQYHLVGG